MRPTRLRAKSCLAREIGFRLVTHRIDTSSGSPARPSLPHEGWLRTCHTGAARYGICHAHGQLEPCIAASAHFGSYKA